MTKNLLSKTLTAIALALPIVSAGALPAAAQKILHVFTITNNTGGDILAIDMIPENSADWRSEILGSRVLRNGESVPFKLYLYRACTRNRDIIYTVKALTSNGNLEKTVSICENSVTLGNSYSGQQQGPYGGQQPGPYGSQPGPYGGQQQGPYGQGGPAIPVPTPPPVPGLPSMFDNFNPNQPLAPNVSTSIRTAMATHGLAEAPCNMNSIVMFTVNGRYTACAYPSPVYAAGKYQMNLPGI